MAKTIRETTRTKGIARIKKVEYMGLSLKTHYRKLQELTKEFFKNEA